MKKNTKKIAILATTTLSSIGLITPIFASTSNQATKALGYSQNNSLDDFNPNSKLNFNGQTYNSLKEAADDYVSATKGNVGSKTFIGDVKGATTIGTPYETVDLSKLREKDDSKTLNAYKTLTDKYVSSVDEAKKTYIKEPIVQWTDNNGKYFDSEQEAKDAMNNDGFTTPVSFYEVNDKYRNKQNVKINPLNKKDNEELKRIAIYNAAEENSGFSISRLEGKTGGNYSFANKEGKTLEEIQNISKAAISAYIDEIKKAISFNVSVGVESDVKELPVYTGSSNMEILRTEYGTEANSDNINKETNYENFLADARYLTDYDLLKQKFDLSGLKPLFGSKEIYKDARMKNDQTLFGGQKYNFVFIEAAKLIAFYSVAFDSNSIGFLGTASKVNAYFNFKINQVKFDEKMKNDEGFRNERKNMANNIVEKAGEQFRNKLLELSSNQFPTNVIDKIVSSIKDESINVLTQKIINDNTDIAHSAKSIVNVQEGMKARVDEVIQVKLDNAFKSKNSTQNSLFYEITNNLKNVLQTEENKNTNDAIYVINYNDQPLYSIDKNLFSNLYISDDFKANPLAAVKKYFYDNIRANGDVFVKATSDKLTNISNSLENKVTDAKPSNVITWDTINEKNSTKNSILKLESKSITVTDTKLDTFKNNFISQDQFNKYFISDYDLNKALNKKESDDLSYLNNKWGTLEAIYQYNKSLEKILTKKQTSPFQSQKLNDNAIKDPKEIVSLFNKDKTPKTIRYAEFFDSGFKFNESLTKGDIDLIYSEEKKDKIVETSGLKKPTKVITIKDYDDNVLVSDVVDSSNNEAVKEQLMQNALNKIQISPSKDFVLYKENDGKTTLLKNSYTKLNTLKIILPGKKEVVYGFASYDNLYKYVLDYIKLNSNGNSMEVVNPPFTKDNIDINSISTILNSFTSLEEVNKLNVQEKFNKFGSAFKINSLEDWTKYINNGLTFSEKNISSRSLFSKNKETEKTAIMSVTLQNGYKFADGSNSFTQDVKYIPSSSVTPTPPVTPPIENLPGDNNNENVTNTNKQSSTFVATAVVVPIIFLIVAEVIVLSITFMNRRKNDDRLSYLKLSQLNLKK